MDTSISDALKSQSNNALAVIVVSGTVLASSLTTNIFEFLMILALCLSSLVLYSYALGIHFYIRKTKTDLSTLRIDPVMEKHTPFSFIKIGATTLFLITVMIVRTHHSLEPAYANVIFSIAVITTCIAMVNSALLNIAKVLLINHRVILASKAI